jgi:lipooligosaccharide transport system permease protein
MPPAIRWLAWISPLWSGNELARGAALGGLGLWPAVGHLAYLLALLAIGAVVARRCYRARLIV